MYYFNCIVHYEYDGYKRSAKCGFRLDYFYVLSDTKAAEFEKASSLSCTHFSRADGESVSCSLASCAGRYTHEGAEGRTALFFPGFDPRSPTFDLLVLRSRALSLRR